MTNILIENDTINVYQMSLKTLFNYVNTPNNYHVLKPWTHLQQSKRACVFRRELEELALQQQLDDIQESVVNDCLHFIGLHKLLDFNIFTKTYKKILFALFTKFCDFKLDRYKIVMNNALGMSLNEDLLEQLTIDEQQDLLRYTELRCQHIQILNPTFNIDRHNYDKLTNSLEYEIFFMESI